MTNPRRRIRKLEAHLTDPSGLVPHTQVWMRYWTQELENALANDERPKKPIPLEVARAYLQACDPDGVLRKELPLC